MSVAFVFPGQGSQAVGMGRSLYEAFAPARRVFEEVDDALGVKLSDLIFNGPADELTLTVNAQPALMAVSLAALRALEGESGLEIPRDVALVAGHSLGEYSALAAAKALSIADAARLLRKRGQAMQAAVPIGVGAMVSLFGFDFETVGEIVAEASRRQDGAACEIANDNGGGQIVVSGAKAAIDRAIEVARKRGAKRWLVLPVSAPFHCSLMQPAADEMRAVLSEVTLSRPVVPLVANVTATAVSDPETIRRLLVSQVTSAVRWRECVAFMRRASVSNFVELGAGKALTGMIRRISPEAVAGTIGEAAEIQAYKVMQPT